MDDAESPRLRIALTGATGFIGQTLQRVLVAAGHELHALVRPGSCNADRVLPGVRSCTVALDDVDALVRELNGMDLLVYAAGSVRGRGAEDFRAANIDGVTAMVAALRTLETPPRLLLISSLAAQRPALSDYAASKRAGEEALAQVADIEWSVLRPPAVYGPGDREMRPLFDALRRGVALVTGPPGQRLSLLHVDDLAAAVLAIAAHWQQCRGQVFEADDGRDNGYDWNDIVAAGAGARRVLRVRPPRLLLDIVARANLALSGPLGYAPMLSPGKVRELSEPSWLCDNRPLTAATGWQPAYDLGAGLASLYGEAG